MRSMERHQVLRNNMLSHKGYEDITTVQHDQWFCSLCVQDTFGINILKCIVILSNMATISRYCHFVTGEGREKIPQGVKMRTAHWPLLQVLNLLVILGLYRNHSPTPPKKIFSGWQPWPVVKVNHYFWDCIHVHNMGSDITQHPTTLNYISMQGWSLYWAFRHIRTLKMVMTLLWTLVNLTLDNAGSLTRFYWIQLQQKLQDTDLI